MQYIKCSIPWTGKGEDCEEGFATGLLNSLVALPLLSAGSIGPLARLPCRADDTPDNVGKEFIIMQALQACSGEYNGKLEVKAFVYFLSACIIKPVMI